MDLTKKTITELESLAYKQIVLQEQTKVNIQLINQELAKRAGEDKKEKKGGSVRGG